MSETMTGAELARLILRRGTTAAEVAAMDLESLTRLVAYRRQNKIPSGAVSPSMTDEQIARAILEYAQSDPGDWPVAPRATTRKRACGPGLLGALGGGVGAIVFVVLGLFVVCGTLAVSENGPYSTPSRVLCWEPLWLFFWEQPSPWWSQESRLEQGT